MPEISEPSSPDTNHTGASPEVSIIINCYNEAKVVRETLDSAFAQTFQDWEIIFWDNASSDGSGDIARSYGDKLRYFRSDTMIHLGTGRKLAYEQTRGKYVAILDADDIWLPKKLERQVELFESNPELGMAYCDAIFLDDNVDRYRLFALNPPHRGQTFGKLVTKNFIFSSTMMFRRDALDFLGCAFDDQFTRVQDYDLTLRMAYHFPIDYVDEPLVKWRINGLVEKPWKKALVPRVTEVKIAMENLLAAYPEIATDYPGPLEYFYRNMDYNFAIAAWQDGKGREARRYLSRHLSTKKFAFVYLCSFFLSSDRFYKLRKIHRDLTTSNG